MPRYLVHAPDAFPEVFNALKAIGEVDGDMPNFVVVATELDIDDVTKIVRESAGSSNTLIVEPKAVQYQGNGNISRIGLFFDRL